MQGCIVYNNQGDILLPERLFYQQPFGYPFEGLANNILGVEWWAKACKLCLFGTGVCTTEYHKNLHVPYLLSNVYNMVP